MCLYACACMYVCVFLFLSIFLENAVVVFQQTYGLPATGVFDEQTANALLDNNSDDNYHDDLQFPLPQQYLYKVYIPVYADRNNRESRRFYFCVLHLENVQTHTCFSFIFCRINCDTVLTKWHRVAQVRCSFARQERRQRRAVQSILSRRHYANWFDGSRFEFSRG